MTIDYYVITLEKKKVEKKINSKNYDKRVGKR